MKYSLTSVIKSPKDPRLNGAIGKLVFCGHCPLECFYYANRNEVDFLGVLQGIGECVWRPFTISKFGSKYGDNGLFEHKATHIIIADLKYFSPITIDFYTNRFLKIE